MEVSIVPITYKDIKKIIYEMNKIFIFSKKNVQFIHWQYFRNINKARLYKIIFGNKFAGISGYQKRFLVNKRKAYHLIGIYVVEKFRGSELIFKSLKFIKKKIIKNNFFFAIPNEQLGNLLKVLFVNMDKLDIYSMLLSKNEINKTIKKINNLNIKKKLNINSSIFYKDNTYFQWRYARHPIYKYYFEETTNLVIIFKIYKKKQTSKLDFIDCIIKKEISIKDYLITILKISLKYDVDFVNIWSFKNSYLKKCLIKLNFRVDKFYKKQLVFKNIVDKNYFLSKHIYPGDADY